MSKDKNYGAERDAAADIAVDNTVGVADYLYERRNSYRSGFKHGASWANARAAEQIDGYKLSEESAVSILNKWVEQAEIAEAKLAQAVEDIRKLRGALEEAMRHATNPTLEEYIWDDLCRRVFRKALSATAAWEKEIK